MTKHRKIIFCATLALACCAACWGQTTAPTSPTPAKPKPADEPLKGSKYSAELPKGEFQDNQIEMVPDQDRRQLRESRYTGAYAEIKDPADSNPTGPTKQTIYVIKDYADRLDPLPASRSAAVVIGTILSSKAYVSKDRTYVYSDFQVRVDEVLKQDPPMNLVVGGRIVASRGGGAIHFPSGHTNDYVNHGEGMPAIGSQYLFFLSRPSAITEPEYQVITGGAYELSHGEVHPLDDFSPELDNASEQELISKVRAAVGAKP
jgi:hypothetical protein